MGGVWPVRRGVGSMPAVCEISQMVVAPVRWPSRAGSPWILRWFHLGVSLANCRMSFLIVARVVGCPFDRRRAP